MFIRYSIDGKCNVLRVCVDVIILTGVWSEEIRDLTDSLGKEFEIKDLGQLKYFFDMKVA